MGSHIRGETVLPVVPIAGPHSFVNLSATIAVVIFDLVWDRHPVRLLPHHHQHKSYHMDSASVAIKFAAALDLHRKCVEFLAWERKHSWH